MSAKNAWHTLRQGWTDTGWGIVMQPAMAFLRFVALILLGLALVTGGASARERSKSWMGVGFDDLSPREARALGWKAPRGVKLKEIVATGPAERVGLRVNDILVARDGVRIKDSADFLGFLKETAPGTKVQFTVLRNGRSRRVGVELDIQWYEVVEPEGWLGLALGNVPPAETEVLGRLSPHGAVVSEVIVGSPAEAGGLKIGDTILSLDGSDIKDYPEFFDREKSKMPGSVGELVIMRDGQRITLTVKFGAVPEFIVSRWDIPASANTHRRAPAIEAVPDVADVQAGVLAVSPDGARLAYGDPRARVTLRLVQMAVLLRQAARTNPCISWILRQAELQRI